MGTGKGIVREGMVVLPGRATELQKPALETGGRRWVVWVRLPAGSPSFPRPRLAAFEQIPTFETTGGLSVYPRTSRSARIAIGIGVRRKREVCPSQRDS